MGKKKSRERRMREDDAPNFDVRSLLFQKWIERLSSDPSRRFAGAYIFWVRLACGPAGQTTLSPWTAFTGNKGGSPSSTSIFATRSRSDCPSPTCESTQG